MRPSPASQAVDTPLDASSGQLASALVPANDRDQLREAIRDAGQRRTRADQAKREATAQLADLFAKGTSLGLTVTEMERLAQVSRQGFYDIRARSE